jgi:hypothetical protein
MAFISTGSELYWGIKSRLIRFSFLSFLTYQVPYRYIIRDTAAQTVINFHAVAQSHMQEQGWRLRKGNGVYGTTTSYYL